MTIRDQPRVISGAVKAMKLQFEKISKDTSIFPEYKEMAGQEVWLDVFREKRSRQVQDTVSEPDTFWLDVYREKRIASGYDVIEELHEQQTTQETAEQVAQPAPQPVLYKSRKPCKRNNSKKKQIQTQQTGKLTKKEMELKLIKMIRNCNRLNSVLDQMISLPDQTSLPDSQPIQVLRQKRN